MVTTFLADDHTPGTEGVLKQISEDWPDFPIVASSWPLCGHTPPAYILKVGYRCMNSDSKGLAAVLVIVCALGTITVFAMGMIMDDPAEYPEYSISGTDPDGNSVTGTVSCNDTNESETRKVLRFDFTIIGADDDVLELTSYLMTDEEGMPTSELYADAGERTIGEIVTSVWVKDGFGYCMHEGSVVAVIYNGDGYNILAQAMP